MKAEEQNALLLLAGLGVAAWIAYAVNSKGATVARPESGEIKIEPGERWRVVLGISGKGAPTAETYRPDDYRAVMADVADVELIDGVFAKDNSLAKITMTLRYKAKATMPAVGTSIPWGSARATLLERTRLENA